MLNSIRKLLRLTAPEPIAEQLAYREQLSIALMRIGKVSAAVSAAIQGELLVGTLVGTVFARALNTRGTFRDTVTPECLHTLTIRLAHAARAVSQEAGVAFTETTLSNALAIVNLRFVETEMAAEIVPYYVKQLNDLGGSPSPALAAEEIMTMRFIDREDLFVWQTLGRQIEREIRKGRTALRAQIREVFDDRGGLRPDHERPDCLFSHIGQQATCGQDQRLSRTPLRSARYAHRRAAEDARSPGA